MASNYTDSFAGTPYFIKKGEPLSADGMTAALNTREKVANKAITLGAGSTDDQYPSAKAVYDTLNGTSNDIVHKAGAETITAVKTFGTASAAAEPLLGLAKTTDATNSGIKFASEAQVYKVAQAAAGADVLPVGTILAMSTSSWTNASASFKSKWRVCDGTGGSPDLRGRFLRGGTATDQLTGGADSRSITLSTEHLPAHNHGITDKQHSHTAQAYIAYGGTDAAHFGVGHTPENTKAAGLAYTHNSYTGITGTENTGGGQPYSIEIVPKYYTVIYIIKVT